MLQTPINVEPSGGRVKTVGDTININFTFQGDLLTFVQGQIRDMEDNGGSSLGTINYNMPKGGHLSVIHNGQKVSYTDDGWMASRLTPGHNYKHFFRLFQHYPEGMRSGSTNIAGRPMPDMYYARGKIYQKSYGTYNNKSAYKRGDVCTSSGNTYACNTNITKNEDDEYNSDGSSFNASHWTRVYGYQTVIEPDLENIREPFYYEWDTTDEGVTTHHKILLGAIYMDILYERHMISAYDKTTGIVTFQKVTFNSNTQGYTAQEVTNIQDDSLSSSSYFKIDKHNPYKMYVNYLETGWYDFKWRNKPTITDSVTVNIINRFISSNDDIVGLQCSGTYSHSEAVGLKWYKYQLYSIDATNYSTSKVYHVSDRVVYNDKLYRCLVQSSTAGNFRANQWGEISIDDNNTKSTLIDETDRIFNYDLTTGFPAHPFAHGYAIKLTIATQDDDIESTVTYIGQFEENPNHTFDDMQFAPISINNKSFVFNNHSNDVMINDSKVTIKWSIETASTTDSPSYFNVYRREVYKNGSLAPFATYVTTAHIYRHLIPSTHYEYTFTDYSVANNKTYQYELVANGLTTYGNGIPYCAAYIYNVHIKWDGWRIIGLTPINDEVNRHWMAVGDEWSFISEIDSGDITRNITSVLHVGTSAYAKTTRNNTKYESGSFTANLLTVSCPDNQVIDDIEQVNKWMEFICGDNPFLLKSDKGDVWVVSIVNSPSRQYNETYDPIFTKVRYEWAESNDLNKCVFDDYLYK